MENFMVLDSISGKMAASTKDSSEMVKSMVMESGEKETATKNMKASFKKIENKDMESIPGEMEIFTKVTTTLISDMEVERCTGMITLSTKDHGWLISRMERGLFLMANSSSKEHFKMEKWWDSTFLKSNIEVSANFISTPYQPDG